jgi:hypothetical protein
VAFVARPFSRQPTAKILNNRTEHWTEEQPAYLVYVYYSLAWSPVNSCSPWRSSAISEAAGEQECAKPSTPITVPVPHEVTLHLLHRHCPWPASALQSYQARACALGRAEDVLLQLFATLFDSLKDELPKYSSNIRAQRPPGRYWCYQSKRSTSSEGLGPS